MALGQHILFPFDLSNQAFQAAPFVRAFADLLGARVTVLGVVPPVWNSPSAEMMVLVSDDGEARERELKPRLERACATAFAGMSVLPATVLGDPALKIVEYANSNDVTLIMMPTHGLGVFRSLLIGSVTAKVLHDAKCPVWTAAHAAEQKAPVKPRTVMCAIDGASDETVNLVRWADDFAHRTGASLRLLHVVPPISDWLAIPSERELQEELRTSARIQIEKCLQDAGLNLPQRVAVRRISETVAEEARQEGDDLIVIGRGAAGAVLGRMKSHVYKVIQQSPVPVISV